MERIVLRHLSGSKSNQVEEFPLNHVKELIFGRDTSATVKYDPDRDDLVGRQHARIDRDGTDAQAFIITDLNSRNGTFVNRNRIAGPTRISPGDRVQLGPGGPEFVFDVEPRPQNNTKATRIAATPTASSSPATRIAPTPAAPPTVAAPIASPSSAPPAQVSPAAVMPPTPAPTGTVGKATVERMISHNIQETKKSEGRKYLLIGGAALACVLALFTVVGGFLAYRNHTANAELGSLKSSLAADKANASLDASTIATQMGEAVVKIDCVWRLVSPQGDGNVYHQLYPLPGGREVALYYQLPDGSIEPALTYTANPNSYAIGGSHSGTGFAVSSDGFVLTNRHVAAAWETSFTFPQRAYPGVVLNVATNQPRMLAPAEIAQINWVPARSKQTKIQFEGRNDSLYVTFPKQDSRIVAKLNRVSPRHDVALIKIDTPGAVPKVDINDNYDSIKQGDDVVVLGYPGVSPPVYGIVKSQDVFNRETQIAEIPDPTFSKGNIGRILRGDEKAGGAGDKDTFSHIGDAYQLTINSTGAGNSGGPVLDGKGRVVGIFYAGKQTDAMITFAVPIKYGKELMGITTASN